MVSPSLFSLFSLAYSICSCQCTSTFTHIRPYATHNVFIQLHSELLPAIIYTSLEIKKEKKKKTNKKNPVFSKQSTAIENEIKTNGFFSRRSLSEEKNRKITWII